MNFAAVSNVTIFNRCVTSIWQPRKSHFRKLSLALHQSTKVYTDPNLSLAYLSKATALKWALHASIHSN